MNTLEEVKQSKKEFLVPSDVAPILGCDRYNITLMARHYPEKLGFPVIVIKNRTKIPRLAFIAFMEGGMKGVYHK